MTKLPATDRFRCASADYRSAQTHSAELDLELGYQCEAVESGLVRAAYRIDQQPWIGLALQALQTPYSELLEILERVIPAAGSLWVDVGAGYGRMALVLAARFSEARFQGFELVPERVEEAKRVWAQFDLPQARIEAADMASPEFHWPEADGYFLYDFGSREDIQRSLEALRLVARLRPITVVARGRGVRHEIDSRHPWLGQVNRAEHFPHYSIYRS